MQKRYVKLADVGTILILLYCDSHYFMLPLIFIVSVECICGTVTGFNGYKGRFRSPLHLCFVTSTSLFITLVEIVFAWRYGAVRTYSEAATNKHGKNILVHLSYFFVSYLTVLSH